jgi:hypothetical protein
MGVAAGFHARGDSHSSPHYLQHLVEFRRNTTMWDRWFNRDGPTGLAYREARKVRRNAEAAVAGGQKQIKVLCAGLDRRIEPMMSRLDPGYQIGRLIIKSCASALRECRAMRNPIETFAGTVRQVTQDGRDLRARKEAATARLRYPYHLVRARKAAGTVKQAVNRVRRAAARSGDKAPCPEWTAAAFDRLPRTAEGMSALQTLVRELSNVNQAVSRLSRLEADLADLRRRTTEAQRAAVIRAREKLILTVTGPS